MKSPVTVLFCHCWKLSFLLLFLIGGMVTAQAKQSGPKLVHAGPMIGHVTDTTASVWIRIKRGAQLEGIARQGNATHAITHWEDRGADCHVVGFTGLKPSTDTVVDLSLEREGSEPEEVSLEFKTYPEPADTGTVRLAFGSCSKISQYPKGPIYQAITDEAPEAMIFLGDNAYFIVADGSERHFGTTGDFGDWSFPDSMRARHLLTRVHPDLQPLLRRVSSYGIWDDHDYGPNNADRTFELKEEALRVFKQMWANPSWGLPDTPGIFSSFRCGPAEVFLMDDRYYKYSPQAHKDVTPQSGEIWGQRQLDWLLEGLKKSTAPVKVVANGTQVITRDDRGEGHSQEARGEQSRLLEFLAEHEIGGVIFLSGDRHSSEAMQQAQPDGTLVVEATSSPLQQDQPIGPFSRTHPNMIWSMHGNNFGLLTIEVEEEATGSITFETRDESNVTPTVEGTLCRTTWTLDQLNYGDDPDKTPVPAVWTPLFNGNDLSGWTQRNGTATYRVEDGVIVGKTNEGSPNSFLCTEVDHADFDLWFEVKVDDALNSGVQIRSQSLPEFKNGRVHGPQVEIAVGGSAGYLYSEGTGRGWISPEQPATDAFHKGEWNLYHVRAEGDRIQTWINGKPIADTRDPDSPRAGFIGLQVHGIAKDTGPYEVRWRNLAIRPIQSH